MQIWLERYALPICAAIVFGLCSLSLHERIALFLTITAVSVLIAYVIHLLKTSEKSSRREIRVQLGGLLKEAEGLIRVCEGGLEAAPKKQANEWELRTENFLQKLGPDYVVRFRSVAGLLPMTCETCDQARHELYERLYFRASRLAQFIAEFKN
jgi:hypothetical protein